MARFIALSAAVGLALVGGAMGCDEDFTPPAPIVRIDIGIGDCGNLREGETCDLEPRVFDADNALVEGVFLNWSSDNTNVATVDFMGRVTGVREGNAMIRATLGALVDEVFLSVADNPRPPEDDLP